MHRTTQGYEPRWISFQVQADGRYCDPFDATQGTRSVAVLVDASDIVHGLVDFWAALEVLRRLAGWGDWGGLLSRGRGRAIAKCEGLLVDIGWLRSMSRRLGETYRLR